MLFFPDWTMTNVKGLFSYGGFSSFLLACAFQDHLLNLVLDFSQYFLENFCPSSLQVLLTLQSLSLFFALWLTNLCHFLHFHFSASALSLKVLFTFYPFFPLFTLTDLFKNSWFLYLSKFYLLLSLSLSPILLTFLWEGPIK